MKILVLSDSHSGMSFMRYAIRAVRPDAVVHLGDYYDDATALAEEYPELPIHQVPGNCDKYRLSGLQREMLCYPVCGVSLYMTHGHIHYVKQTLTRLLADARSRGAAAALYGHTHEAYCHQEDDGLLVLNPGACGSFGGSVGLIETDNGQIRSCRILWQRDLEEML